MSQVWAEDLRKADININASGNNTIITGIANAFIAIDHINLIPSAAVTVQFKDGTTNYGGAYSLSANQGLVIENTILNKGGIIRLTNGNNFIINLSGAVQVSGFVRYRVVGQ